MARKKSRKRLDFKNYQGKKKVNDKRPLCKEKLDDGILVGSLGNTVKIVALLLLAYLMVCFDANYLLDFIALYGSMVTIDDYHAKRMDG